MLSPSSCNPKDRLIVALDGMTLEQAKQLVSQLSDDVVFYKIGLELFMSGDYFKLLDWLDRKNKKVFADLKLFDIPQTVASSIKQLTRTATTFVTVHGNQSILEAAAAEKGAMKILAVTALTSLDKDDMTDLGFQCDIENLVFSRAKRALQVGCDGIVSSGLEVAKIRAAFMDKLLLVTPGIRPVSNTDDQKRVVSLEQAFINGADYIVVGRPIHKSDTPVIIAQTMQQQIRQLFTD